MQPITDYAKKEARLRLLLQGPPGSGKTTLACSFPKPYIIDIDVNLDGPLRFRSKRNLPLPVGYDRLDIDEKGAAVPPVARYLRLDRCLIEAQQNPDIETIVIDSATGFTDILMEEVKRRQPGVKDGRQLWGFFFEYGKQFLATLTSMRKHIVLIAHERVEKDEVEGGLKYRVNWPGQLGDLIGGFFTDVWRAEVQSIGGLQPSYKWVVRTMPDYRFTLKNGFEFPAIFEFSWALVEQKMKA